MLSDTKRVLIAGGGVAALEAGLALRKLAPDLVRVELLAPERSFTYGPLAVATPFDDDRRLEFELVDLAREMGASVTQARLTGIDAWRHLAHTSTNHDLEYDVLLVACGALPMPSVAGALTFRGPSDVELVRTVLDDIRRGVIDSLAVVVPWGAAWPLPAYELALLTAGYVDSRVELWLVTPEPEPLQLFGPPASDAVRDLLAQRGVSLRTASYAEAVIDGELRLLPEGTLSVDRVIALPRLVGAPIDGIPQTVDGFIPVDEHGRVQGLDDVYAAGDITTFPVKHGGLATQQALAAAEAIAATAGADLHPRPFRPVVQGLLLTGGAPRFLRRDLGDESPHEPIATYEPLWWPPTKVVGRHLAPFLASRADAAAASPGDFGEGLPIVRPLDADALARLNGSLPTGDADDMDAPDGSHVAAVPLVVVAPEDTLGEIAERILHEGATAVLVVEFGRLVGILADSDLLRAFAARAHPSEARARQWMTAEPIALSAEASSAAAARLMRAYHIHHLPLVEDERPVGLLHLEEEDLSAPSGVGLGF